MRNHSGNLHKEAKALPSSKTRPNKMRLRSTMVQRDLSWQSRLSEKGAKRLLTIAFFSQVWLSFSTPVENFFLPDLTGLASLALRHKDVAKTWMQKNGEIEFFVMKINSQEYPWGRFSSKFSSAPHLPRSPHQLQILIHTVQWKLPGNTLDDQLGLQMYNTLTYNNLMMPSLGYSAHGYN